MATKFVEKKLQFAAVQYMCVGRMQRILILFHNRYEAQATGPIAKFYTDRKFIFFPSKANKNEHWLSFFIYF